MKILLVDDHAIVRTGVRKLLSMVSGAEALEATTGRESLALAKAHKLDMIILDLNLPELGGLELLGRLLRIAPTPILILSMHAEPLYVRRALEAGAQGYVSKNATPEELLTAIREVGEGRQYIEREIAQALILQVDAPIASIAHLAPRELEILRLLASGRSLNEIAEALGIGYKTVANNCTAIKSKLAVTKTSDLLRVALEAGVT